MRSVQFSCSVASVFLPPHGLQHTRLPCPSQTPGVLEGKGVDKHEASSFQLLSCVQLFSTPWAAAHQASLSFTISQSLFKLMSFELVMLSNHLILCHPLLLLFSIFPIIRDFPNELALPIRWPKY